MKNNSFTILYGFRYLLEFSMLLLILSKKNKNFERFLIKKDIVQRAGLKHRLN